MLEFFENTRDPIRTALKDLMAEQTEKLSHINPLGRDVGRRLAGFAALGKLIRGGLVLLSSRMFGYTHCGQALKAAAAIELLQAAFLIHDDIMDQDTRRRGQPTIFHQYQRIGEERAFCEPRRFGESMGICAGDISFFLVIDILSALETKSSIKQNLISLCTREIINTCVAQMQDVQWGYQEDPVEEEMIVRLYVYKTARYTFSPPLVMGAMLTEQGEGVQDSLTKIGEYLGIIFQIRIPRDNL